MRSRTQFILGGFALALTLISTSASAQNLKQDSAQTIEFRYGQSELSTASGASGVYQRLTELADETCDKEYGRFAPRHQARKHRCVQDIVQQIVDEIPDVTFQAVAQKQQRRERKDPVLYSMKTN